MSENEIKLIVKYLNRHYPITKIKFKNKFKRGIELINYSTHTSLKIPLKEKSNHYKIIDHIVSDVSLVLGLKQIKVKPLIEKYISRY
jgi:hypothetical protein